MIVKIDVQGIVSSVLCKKTLEKEKVFARFDPARGFLFNGCNGCYSPCQECRACEKESITEIIEYMKEGSENGFDQTVFG